MLNDKTVSEKAVLQNYAHGDLLNAIEAGLTKLGKSKENVSLDDLAPVDEFHIGSRGATVHLMQQLAFSAKSHVLDVGCGLGGAARFVATQFNNKVSGIDLTSEYIATGNALCQWLGLSDQISLQQGSALSMPYQSNTFDGAYMMHVGMNIKDKTALFSEIYRVLSPGAMFGIYDVMRVQAGDLAYPVPWASNDVDSLLANEADYVNALQSAGFKVEAVNNRHDFALQFFDDVRLRNEKNGGLPPLGLHTLMQASTGQKLTNLMSNINRKLVSPTEIIVRKV
ncbi:MAG: methyltransferase domain-containing protein [Psychrobium sp.]|nr:methyltransferase domain-containing protein [Psychrobium sp.]